MASAQKIVAFNDECEGVRYSDWICDLDTCPGRRHVADHASEATPIVEDDVSRLQGPMALSFSTFEHGQIRCASNLSMGRLEIGKSLPK
jgi:hypothetical protein